MTTSKKKRVSKHGVPTGYDCQSFTVCSICGSQRPTAARIAKGLIKRAQCHCKNDETGRNLSTSNTSTMKRCIYPAINDTLRCFRHGGLRPRGQDNATYSNGKQVKFIPLHLKQAYDRTMANDKFTNLHEQVALCDAREDELMHELEVIGMSSKEKLKELDKAIHQLRASLGQDEPDVEVLRKKFERLEFELGAVRTNDITWSKIHRNIDMRRSLVETENRYKDRLMGTVTPEQLMIFASQVELAVKRNISDRKVVNLVAKDLRKITGSGDDKIDAIELERKIPAPQEWMELSIDESTLAYSEQRA